MMLYKVFGSKIPNKTQPATVDKVDEEMVVLRIDSGLITRHYWHGWFKHQLVSIISNGSNFTNHSIPM